VTEDGETLLAALECRDEVMRQLSTAVAYARMRADEDTRDQTYQAMETRARSLSAEASSAASYLEPEVQSLDPASLESMVASTDGLERYDHYLDDVIRLAPHTRSAEVEALLSDLGEVMSTPGEVFNLLTNADMTFPTVERADGEAVEITQSNFTRLLKEPDREFRESVYDAFYGELADVRNTLATTLAKSVRADVKLARARDYETAREAAMDGPNVPVDVYDTVVGTVRDNLDVLHRHATLKRRAIGVDQLQMWDLYMPVTADDGPEIDYESAAQHVIEAVAPLGDAYRRRVAEGVESSWIDVYENRGKQSGAYSGGTYDTHPFVLMNYQDDVTDMFTLAHELGHSMHSELASEAQPYVYGDYSIFVAEVASMVNEALLTHHLLETVRDDHFRRHVLNEYVERFRSTLYRQSMFAAFEHEIHSLSEDDVPLTPDRLDDTYGELKREFYAPVSTDDHIDREWMRIPHFYYNYYVYQYATGISAAAEIVTRVLEEGDSAAEDYLDALRLGNSAYPLEILETAGVDMRTAEPIEAAVDEYASALDELEALLD
jgi:oligoendopeptidase F